MNTGVDSAACMEGSRRKEIQRVHDSRIVIRLIKLGLLIAALGFVGEGLFEVRKLVVAMAAPPSVPGQSKILEHFALQHLAFPMVCLLLPLRPVWLLGLVRSAASRWYLAVLAAILILPEALVSLGGPGGGDLLRPYPFDLRMDLLRSIQMVEVAGHFLNTLQLQHLLLNHVLLTGVLFTLALRPASLRAFFGPHTGGGVP